MASDQPLSLADRLTQAIDLAEAIYRDMHTDESVNASQVLSASIDVTWAITRLSRAREHLGGAKEGPGYDL